MYRIKPEQREKFESFVQEIMREQRAEGLAVALVTADDGTAYEKFFGCRDLKKGLPVNGDTIFGLASITKSFTSLSIMQLAEKGIIDIYAPIQRYIPSFAFPNILVWHFMSHCAGFFPLSRILVANVAAEMGITQEKDGDFAYNERLADEGERLVTERLSSQNKFTGKPGEYFSYCNDGYAILSAIIKKYGGEKTYSDYVKKHILLPLGMERSGCDFLYPFKDDNVTRLYMGRSDDKRIDTDDYCDNAFVLMGGGGIKSTLNNMKKYITMYLNNGRTPEGKLIAKAESIREMIKPRISVGINSVYGLGLDTCVMDDLKLYGHGGGLTGVSSQFFFSYEAGAGVIVLCNTSDVTSEKIALAAIRMLRNKDIDRNDDIYTETEWSEEQLNAVCGEYISGEGSTTLVYRKDGGIIIKLDNDEHNAVPVNPYTLRIKVDNTVKLFKVYKNENEEVRALSVGIRMVPKSPK